MTPDPVRLLRCDVGETLVGAGSSLHDYVGHDGAGAVYLTPASLER